MMLQQSIANMTHSLTRSPYVLNSHALNFVSAKTDEVGARDGVKSLNSFFCDNPP